MSIQNLKNYFSFHRVANAITELDGMRSIAVLLIFLFHASLGLAYGDHEGFPFYGWRVENLLYNLYFGLEMFFVLGGFLIFRRLITQFEQPGDGFAKKTIRFFKDRLLRIYPAYAAVVLLTAIGAFSAFYTPLTEDLFSSTIVHLLFLQDYFEADLNASYWALAVEFHFYLAAPFVTWAVFKTRLKDYRYVVFGLLFMLPTLLRYLTPVVAEDFTMVSARYVNMFRTPFHLYFDCFVVGGICFMLYRDREKVFGAVRYHIGWILFMGSLIVIGPFWVQDTFFAYVGVKGQVVGGLDQMVTQAILAVGVGLFLLGILLGAGPARFLNSYFCLMLARTSYPFYLVHVPMIFLGVKTYKYIRDMLMISAEAWPFLQWVCATALGFLFSFILAVMIHFIVEKPFLLIKMRRQLSGGAG